MSTGTTFAVDSTSTAQSERLGEQLGKHLRGGEVIELRSDLGGGKTTLVRGIARGAGSNDSVASPSFTISREYDAPKFTILHYDFYRLSEAGLMAQELADKLGDSSLVVIVEWADVVEDVLPAERAIISITASGENSRRFEITLPPEYDYLKVSP